LVAVAEDLVEIVLVAVVAVEEVVAEEEQILGVHNLDEGLIKGLGTIGLE
jgi:hypothetical protein